MDKGIDRGDWVELRENHACYQGDGSKYAGESTAEEVIAVPYTVEQERMILSRCHDYAVMTLQSIKFTQVHKNNQSEAGETNSPKRIVFTTN